MLFGCLVTRFIDVFIVLKDCLKFVMIIAV